MNKRDYYEVLGIERNASESDIKRAYRRMALKYHPDKHAGDKQAEEKFKEINEAYVVLKDPQKRAQYDRFGFSGVNGGGMSDFEHGFDFQDIFGDVFGDFFGGGRKSRVQKGADLGYELEVTFEEAAFGTDKKITIPKQSLCNICNGNGAKQGTSPTTCPTCGGKGQLKYQQGFFSVSRPCSSCRGAGFIIREVCPECHGNGAVKIKHDVSVKIPPGVETGTRLRMTGEGDMGGHGGPPGDLYIIIGVKPHPIFKRQDNDIVCEVPVSFPQAALGSEMHIPTLEGTMTVKIPAGTQSGRVLRLKGKGIASLRTGRRGDQRILVRVETPTRLTKRQCELLQEFASISGEETTPLKQGFFDKVKELFENG